MSLVWTFTVIVPFIKGTNYGNGSCSLAGINGVPPVCRNHTYFNKINLFSNNGVSWLRLHITFAYISTVPIFIFRLNWALTGPLTPCCGIKNNNYSGIGVKRLYLSRKLRPVTVMSLSKLCLITFLFQKWCKEDEFCDEMISQSDCIQFYVKSDDKFFILHEDEIDITGMCQDQIHCSGIISNSFLRKSKFVTSDMFCHFDPIVDFKRQLSKK